MRLVVTAMELEDVSEVLEVDRESYTLPWPASAYRREILHNRNARYFVLRQELDSNEENEDERGEDERPRRALPFLRWPLRPHESTPTRSRIVGYAGMWLMIDEAHITTIAIRTQWRARGLGELLLATLIEAATDIGAHRVTLEVRVSNETAQNLYRKYGFHQQGIRPRYYSDNNEDAYIMTTENILDGVYRERFERLVDRLYHRLHGGNGVRVLAPPFPLTEEPSGRGAD